MATDDSHQGRASGYSVEEDPEGGFRWSAFGPAGARDGHAGSWSEAEAAAQLAEQELSLPPTSP
jgi:hypothetical protein